MSSPKIIIIPSPTLPAQTWWPSLHALITLSFLHKPSLHGASAFPPSWKRLDPNIALAAQKLGNDELGPQGHLAVVFSPDDDGLTTPLACGGVLPYRGDNWIDEVETDRPLAAPLPPNSAIPDWEICCFCVGPSQRGKGISSALLDFLVDFIKPKGAERLYTMYVIGETGEYWPKMGFETVKADAGVLKKGFTHSEGMEGLRGDVFFRLGAKTLS